jgi:8-oxo-dGTP diphosphatase
VATTEKHVPAHAPDQSTIGNRDSHAPRVDLRTVLFTVADSKLQIALHGDRLNATLPRSEPKPNESLDTTARRTIRASTALQEQYLEQLYTLSMGESKGWSIIVGYIGLISSSPQTAPLSDASWWDVNDLPKLSDSDERVIEYAHLRLRAKLGYTNIAFHLLPRSFTLTELQNAYESILGRRLDKRNFRRRVIASGILQSTNQQRREGSHRPAALYRFRAEHDPADYLTPAWAEEA